jgi:GTP-binding protein HflX
MEAWGVEVRDRTQVILQIFDRNARTQQAKLMVEKARLSYELPFERHQIRMKLQQEHTGDRPVAEQVGAGEDLLNLRIREIRRRVAAIEVKLRKITEAQSLKRKRRVHRGFLEVTLAGYTNAGKSTLHNAFTGSNAEIANELFTTLSTKARELGIPGRQVVLSDSVGFISDLPRSLLQAFNTTLLELSNASTIVLVIDGSDAPREMMRKLHTCLDTFIDIEVNDIHRIIALNKVDLLSPDEVTARIKLLEKEDSTVIPVSGLEGTNLDALLLAIDESLPKIYCYSIEFEYNDSTMSVLSWLHEIGHVESQDFTGDRVKVQAILNHSAIQKLSKRLPEVRLQRIDQE